MTRALKAAAIAALSLALLVPVQAADDVPLYRATYQAEYKGRNVGTSEHSVALDGERGVYTFASRTTVKGLLRMANPNPAIEESSFVVDGGALKPLAYRYEDGSRRGEDNYVLAFDWGRNVAVATGGNGEREVALVPGALDRGSLQVQLMRDLAAGRTPGRYSLADESAVAAYDYTANGADQVQTALGALDTVVYVQRREGSSRETWLWLAPSLSYLPVRIEQRRDGETRTAFLLQSVSGLGSR